MAGTMVGRTWVEYRNETNLARLGDRLRAYKRKKDGGHYHQLMEAVRPGDLILHLQQKNNDNFLVGRSVAAGKSSSKNGFYIIHLAKFTKIEPNISIKKLFVTKYLSIIKELENNIRPHYLPFAILESGDVRIPQGFYFGRAPVVLKQVVGLPTTEEEPFGTEPNGPDGGPTGEGTKIVAWSARQHPLVWTLHARLKKQGWKNSSGAPWRPDLLMRKDKNLLLVEVKPDSFAHNIITAIGQIVCYREPHNDKIISVIATIGPIKDDISKIMYKLGINSLDIGKINWPDALDSILETGKTRTNT
jgi:hypothetical protein